MALYECNGLIDESGLELLSHGTKSFPAACYQGDLSAKAVPWHWHDEWEVIVITEGCARIMAGTETCLVQPGEAVFTNSGVFHTDLAQNSGSCRYYSIVFHPELVGGNHSSVFWLDYVRPLIEDKTMQCIHFKEIVPWQGQAIAAVEEAWQSAVREELGYPFRVRSALSKLLLLIWENRNISREPPDPKHLRDSQRVKDMLRFIASSYADPITLEQIAASAAISKSECLRCFRGILHTSPVQHLREYRLQVAAVQLRASDQKVSEIARQCGFLEMSYFSKVFRQKYGCSPVEYRRS